MTVYCSANSRDTSRITITSEQLRTTNLIFAEHNRYSKLVPLLQQENTNLTLINESWERTDSIKTLQLQQRNQMIEQQRKEVEKLNKDLNTSITIGGTAVGISIVVTVLCLFLK